MVNIDSISIPGTHYSSTYATTMIAGAEFVKCQDISITEQLNAGIRYLDIGIRHINNEFAIHHGSFYLNLNFNDVLDMVSSFLKQNPSETILMRVSIPEYEDGPGNTRSYADTFRDYDVRYPNLFWRNKNEKNPMIDNIRGRVVVLRDGLDDANFGLDYKSFTIQDDYEPTDVNKKIKDVEASLDNANDGQRKLINHVSGHIVYFKGIYTPYGLSKIMNGVAVNWITIRNPPYVGIIPADFPSSDLIGAVIRTNLYPNTPSPFWCDVAKPLCSNGLMQEMAVIMKNNYWKSQKSACEDCHKACEPYGCQYSNYFFKLFIKFI